jgi:hypothetical protein
MTSSPDTVTIRRATPSDGVALDRLAALDSAMPLTGDVLVAEAGGRVAAALSLRSGRAVSDPFLPTADLVALLRARAGRLVAPRSALLARVSRRRLPLAAGRPKPIPRARLSRAHAARDKRVTLPTWELRPGREAALLRRSFNSCAKAGKLAI